MSQNHPFPYYSRWSRNYGDLDMIAHGWRKRPNSSMDETFPTGGSPEWISRLVAMSRPNNSLIIHSCLLLAYCSTVWAWVGLATPCPICYVCLDDMKTCVTNRRRTLPFALLHPSSTQPCSILCLDDMKAQRGCHCGHEATKPLRTTIGPSSLPLRSTPSRSREAKSRIRVATTTLANKFSRLFGECCPVLSGIQKGWVVREIGEATTLSLRRDP